MHISAKANIINLLTDSNLKIMGGSVPMELIAPFSGDLKGKSIAQLFPAVSPELLNNIRHICLHQPGIPCAVQLKVGVNGHARLFKWEVCAPASDVGGKLLWEGKAVNEAVPADHSDTMRNAILEIIPDAVTTLDAQFRITGFNKKAEALFGLVASQVMGTDINDHNHLCTFAKAFTNALHQVQTVGSGQGSFVLEGANASQLIVEAHFSQVRDGQDSIIGYLALGKVVSCVPQTGATQYKEKERDQLLAKIMDESGAIAWATDLEGKKKYWNTNFTQLAGLEDTSPYLSIYDLFDAETAQRYQQENELVVKELKTISKVEPGTAKSGTPRWYRTLKFPVITPDGVLAAGFGYDVTDEYLRELELTYLRQRYEIAASITADIISDWDIENDRLWRSDPLRWVPVHARKARSMQERFGRLHPDDKQRFIYSLNQSLLSEDASWECEYRYVLSGDQEGYKILHEKGVIMRDETGEAIRMISVVRDVTGERRLTEEVKHKERQVIVATIEGQENERNELARELHDNVGQVLAMCKLFVDIAADSVQHAYMDKCRNHLQKAIQEIRSLSHRLSPELLDRKGLPGAVASLADNLGQAGGFTIDLFFSQDLQTVELVKSVQTAAYRIVQEAMNNILKHAHADKVLVHLQIEGDSLMIHIRDNGVGFDPQKVAGGIGLRNIYNRVEMAGGKIYLETAPGSGCAIKVVLPMHQDSK